MIPDLCSPAEIKSRPRGGIYPGRILGFARKMSIKANRLMAHLCAWVHAAGHITRQALAILAGSGYMKPGSSPLGCGRARSQARPLHGRLENARHDGRRIKEKPPLQPKLGKTTKMESA
ncbi:predicted protein [Brucella neotomae 5K33]|uniref:Uncharacterized protein n=1 Tax=Brucella neotomae 5K33 TaxID=520456 RepID=A0A7U8K9F8_BRUNE|nr:predicted protein [Brucella neotomae 5K33]